MDKKAVRQVLKGSAHCHRHILMKGSEIFQLRNGSGNFGCFSLVYPETKQVDMGSHVLLQLTGATVETCSIGSQCKNFP